VDGWKDGMMEEGKCLNHRLHGEERLLSARFSFNAGTSNQGIKKSRNQEINGMNACWRSPGRNRILKNRDRNPSYRRANA